ncbi:hypothetical protein BT96DRAFT_72526 [Gymnopus androsaceus JB14]|uniref:Secreted protein n=1 Tax=Gymnopus androsaceus JB14 TaxID=1447944 RepID=A0A6A4HIR2_9AGAR|nr:hypothetical protein BT96DRAFT_72526 [Gymnopus androsaceus JB14]
MNHGPWLATVSALLRLLRSDYLSFKHEGRCESAGIRPTGLMHPPGCTGDVEQASQRNPFLVHCHQMFQRPRTGSMHPEYETSFSKKSFPYPSLSSHVPTPMATNSKLNRTTHWVQPYHGRRADNTSTVF